MYEEQISFFDLVKILQKHKILFWVTFLLVVAGGIYASCIASSKSGYVQAIKIAGYVGRKGEVSFINDKTLITKMQNIYLPMAQKSYCTKHACGKSYPGNVSASLGLDGGSSESIGFNITADNSVIYLSGKGSDAQQDAYRELFKIVLSEVQSDTAPIYESFKHNLTEYITKARQYLSDSNINEGATPLSLKALEDLKKAEFILSTLHNSHFDSEFMVSPAKAVSRSALIILFAIVAFIAGFIAVLFAEFVSKVKTEKK